MDEFTVALSDEQDAEMIAEAAAQVVAAGGVVRESPDGSLEIFFPEPN